MRTTGAAIAVALILAGGLGSSDAWSQSVEIGPGGVRVRPDDDGRRYRRRGGERCRTVIEQRRNRFGERVTERRRICRED
jgi:hypothetical protein